MTVPALANAYRLGSFATRVPALGALDVPPAQEPLEQRDPADRELVVRSVAQSDALRLSSR